MITDNKLTWADTYRHIWIHDELSYCPWHCGFGKNILLILSFMSVALSRFQIDIYKRVCSQKHPAHPCMAPPYSYGGPNWPSGHSLRKCSFSVTLFSHSRGVPTDLQDTAWESGHFLSLTGCPSWPFRCLEFLVQKVVCGAYSKHAKKAWIFCVRPDQKVLSKFCKIVNKKMRDT